MATAAIPTAPANIAPPPHLQMPTNETSHVELELEGAGLPSASPVPPLPPPLELPVPPSGMPQP